MCDIRTTEALVTIQRVLDRAMTSPDAAERAMSKAVRQLMRRSYELQRDELTRALKPTERLEIVAAEERMWSGLRWLASRSSPAASPTAHAT